MTTGHATYYFIVLVKSDEGGKVIVPPSILECEEDVRRFAGLKQLTGKHTHA